MALGLFELGIRCLELRSPGGQECVGRRQNYVGCGRTNAPEACVIGGDDNEAACISNGSLRTLTALERAGVTVWSTAGYTTTFENFNY